MKKSLLPLLAFLLQTDSASAVRGTKRFPADEENLPGNVRKRALQEVDTCNIAGQTTEFTSTQWGVIVPCDAHSTCNFETAEIRDGFQPCCLNNCVCGSTQSKFVPGITRCARFPCTNGSQCGSGICLNGACDFSNTQPLCDADSQCGVNARCRNGRCYCVDSNGFIRPSPKGTTVPAPGSCTGKSNKSVTPAVAPALPPTGNNVIFTSSPFAPSTPAPATPAPSPTPTPEPTLYPLCSPLGGGCGTFTLEGFRPCCYPAVCRQQVCQASLSDTDDAKNALKSSLLVDRGYLSEEERGKRGN